jgi:addiction module RelE/StbE family toxin
MKIEWTETARADLREIRRFIARDSKQYAKRMIERIRVVVEAVSHNPEGGHWLPEIEARDIREIYVANYRIIYRTTPGLIQVLTVLHGSRDFHGDL